MNAPEPPTSTPRNAQPESDATDGPVGLNARLAAALTRGVGTMWSVYLTVLIVGICGYVQEHAPADHPIRKHIGHRRAPAMAE